MLSVIAFLSIFTYSSLCQTNISRKNEAINNQVDHETLRNESHPKESGNIWAILTVNGFLSVTNFVSKFTKQISNLIRLLIFCSKEELSLLLCWFCCLSCNKNNYVFLSPKKSQQKRAKKKTLEKQTTNAYQIDVARPHTIAQGFSVNGLPAKLDTHYENFFFVIQNKID